MINSKKYNVGLYGGSFNPLHLGHLECIIRAASQCNELYIVISYSKNRDDVDVKVKIRWVYQLTKHIGNVKIITLEDACLRKEDYTEEFWKRDSNEVKEKIGKPIDVVFCGSDYDENSFWNVCYEESELKIFGRNKYNSTEIRKNLYEHWDWMPQIVRSHFVKKVLLIGGESVGKSTLTINLANYFNTNYLEEVGRELSELSGTDKYMLADDFTKILLEHKAKEMRLIEESNKVLFEDTDCLITRFYMDFLKDENIIKNAQLAEAIAQLNNYDLILFLEPDVSWIQDGDRSEVIAQDRRKYSEMIKEFYRKYDFNFQVIEGDYESRFEQAVTLVNKMLGMQKNDQNCKEISPNELLKYAETAFNNIDNLTECVANEMIDKVWDDENGEVNVEDFVKRVKLLYIIVSTNETYLEFDDGNLFFGHRIHAHFDNEMNFLSADF